MPFLAGLAVQRPAGSCVSQIARQQLRGALERLSRDELQGVVAHEFSHILNGDARLNMRLTSEQRAALRAEVDRYDAEFLAAEAHAAAARRRHVLRSALVFALLTAALWMGSAL